MNKPSICPYCGLNVYPQVHHEGPADCQEAMRLFTSKLRAFLPKVTPFISAWEMDGWDGSVDGERTYKEVAFAVGHGEQFEDKPPVLYERPGKPLETFREMYGALREEL
jgi:hypothetical protein